MSSRCAGGPRPAAHIAAFQQSMSGICRVMQELAGVVTDQRPNGVTDYARIDAVPEALAAVPAVLGLAVRGPGWPSRAGTSSRGQA